MNNEIYEMNVIGHVESSFCQKFGIPRQSGLAPGAEAILKIAPPYGAPECFRGIEDISHLWVCFIFHATSNQGWKSTVRPPRFGGDQRMGVFATRSNFRPNPIGWSAVKLLNVKHRQGWTFLTVENHDLLDGTPILDIKPYIAFADSIPVATSYDTPPFKLSVQWSTSAEESFRLLSGPLYQKYFNLIESLIRQDPRPAYLFGKPDNDLYAIPIDFLEFHFKMISLECAEIYQVVSHSSHVKIK